MDPLSLVGFGLGGASSLYNMIQGGSALRDARAERARLLAELGSQLAQGDYNSTQAGARELLMRSGILSDALQSQGRGLGAAMSGAGVFNSSATAGAMANQATANQMALADAAAKLAAQTAQNQSANARYLGGVRLGAVGEDIGAAQQQQAGGASGLASVLGGMQQYIQQQQAQSRAAIGAPNGNVLSVGNGSNPAGFNSGWAQGVNTPAPVLTLNNRLLRTFPAPGLTLNAPRTFGRAR